MLAAGAHRNTATPTPQLTAKRPTAATRSETTLHRDVLPPFAALPCPHGFTGQSVTTGRKNERNSSPWPIAS